MLLATIIDKNTGKHSFLYTNVVEGEPKYCGYVIGKAGLSTFDVSVFKDIYEEIKVKPDAKFIMKYKEYDVYLDEKTGYKHYIKDGKEDFLAFVNFNKFNCSLCASRKINKKGDDNSQDNEQIEDIVIETDNHSVYAKLDKFLTVVGIIVFIGATIFTIDGLNQVGEEYKDYFVGYNDVGKISYFNKVDSYEQICYFVNNSPYLTDEEKAILLNEEYLNDVLPYFEDNQEMYYLLNGKLLDLQLDFFEYRESSYFEDTEVIGYYDYDQPNIIHGKENVDKDYYLFHEWDHLFASRYAYIYLKEAVAAISEYEYSGSLNRPYVAQVKNVKMLMEVIGPRIIWRHVRTGKTDELHEELKKYLTEEQFETFIHILKDLNESYDEELTELIHILYKNKYGSDIKDNKQIYDFGGTFREDKVYFNESKMVDDLVILHDRDHLVELGLASSEVVKYKEVYFTKEQFKSFKEVNPDFDKKLNCLEAYIPLVEYLNPVTMWSAFEIPALYKNGDLKIMSSQEAIQNGLYTTGYVICFPVEDFIMYSPFDYHSCEEFEITKYNSLDENVYAKNVECVYLLKSIRQRFPDQTVRVNKGKSRTLTTTS